MEPGKPEASSAVMELLRHYPSLLSDKLDVGVDDRLTGRLILARKPAAGLLPKEEAEEVPEEPEEVDAEKKPN